MEEIKLLQKLTNKEDLTVSESRMLAERILSEEVPPSVKAAILTALSMKGESVVEIKGFVEVIREKMIKVNLNESAIDTCGNGGDNQNTFNISTATAIVSASCGAAVAKHGNRSVSSKSGSADVLEALGAKIDLEKPEAEKSFKESSFTFLFAPLFHPVFKSVGAIRKEIKIRTIFNLLGPLLNPAGVKRQIIGARSLDAAEKIANAARLLGFDHVMVVHAADGMDEISVYDKTHVFEVKKGKIKKYEISASEYNLDGKNKNDILVSTIEESKNKILAVLKGEKGDCRNIVLLNSGAALYISGKYKSISDGISAAEKAIDLGKSLATLNKFIKLSNRNND